MWFDTDVISAAARRFPNWFGLRGRAEDPAAIDAVPRLGGWPGVRPVRETESSKSDGSDGKHLDPEGHADSTWRMGWTDGRSAQPSESYLRLLRAEGALADQGRIEAATLATRQAEARARVNTVAAEHVTRDLERAESELEERARDRKQHLGAYSAILGIFYLTVGASLLFADVPLSLLVSRALGLLNEDLPLDDLSAVIADPLAYWEPLSVAIGLALLGVVFKMAADFFHRTTAQHTKTTQRAGMVLFIVLTILVVTTIVAVGIIRGMTHTLDVAEMKEDAATKMMTDVSNLGLFVFTLMALSFAIGGAVCFSSGVSRLINAVRIRSLEKQVSDLRKDHIAAVQARESELAIVEVLKHKLDSVVSSSGLDVELKSALYLHGYGRGLTVPETALEGATLYDRARRYRDRLIATAVQRENTQREQWRVELAEIPIRQSSQRTPNA
jgi:uncharacterized membrane protein